MRGEVIDRPHAAIKLFSMCEAMRWTHLPARGSLYDQHPDLLDKWRYIFQERAAYEEKKRRADEQKQKNKMRPSRAH